IFALIIAIPLGAAGAVGLASMFGGLLNFDTGGFQLFPQVLLVQTIIALLAPLLAALIPIRRGVKVTVQEAISEVGMGKGQFGQGFLDRLIMNMRFVPLQRPQQISLRNTFRRKGRLALTLITLSLASAIFMAIFSVRASLQLTLDEALDYFDYDVQIVFDRSYRTNRIVRQVQNIPGVTGVETWGFGAARRIRPDDSESDNIIVYAPPPDSDMLNPILLEGRWLEEGDTNALVVNTDMLRNEEDVGVGSMMTMNINGRESEWQVVGIVRGILTGSNAFANYDYYGRVTKEPDRAQISLIRLADRSPDKQLSQGQFLEENYRRNGFRVQQMQTIAQFRGILNTIFNIVIVFLLFMAILLGVVGGLGLMGTMSINVIERTREIGVMRAIGASDGAVLRIVLLEGVIIGLISWIIGGIVALPASRALSSAVGQALLQAEPSYTFSTSGALLWLVTVLFLALFASFLPARSASRLTVREVLSYE
ncbi:MAG: FtsX-like permease family protein, partial [Chloroflexi bacterium]|nr:FtsX-like permease family protein [Chloroflexota bacterium]